MTLLELRDVACVRDGQPVFEGVNLSINRGDVVVVRGKSGAGKTTLLKCIAHLTVYTGDVLYRVPSFRTRVLYVPQRPAILPGTPHDFLNNLAALNAHKTHAQKKESVAADPWERALEISGQWGVDPQLLDREWSNVSGGESQRIALSIALALGTAEVILLDEPTSALDAGSAAAVERFLLSEIQSPDAMLKAIVWITHSDEQAGRVGTRFVKLAGGGCHEEPTPAV
ncbi:hypothetical protein H0H92_000063 [Tricholoma furcatifolium]|nr:hypothetical protein H0H92_000063 [Tricholoma furcatifolium]